MRAFGVTEFGGPEALRSLELPLPEAGSGEVRIRVVAAAVNAVDSLVCRGVARFSDTPPPYVPGADAAGVVDQIGVGTDTDLRFGDRVMAIVLPAGTRGAYAQYVTVPAESVVRVPANAGFEEAATVPMNGLTARLALDTLDLAPGEVVAVTGAAGAVGGYAVQLAKADGLRVVASVAAEDEDLARKLGADIVVGRGPEWTRQVRDHVPDGVDGVVDAAGLGALVLPAVRDAGTVVSLHGQDGTEDRGIVVKSVVVFQYARERGKLDRLRQQVEEGVLLPRVARVLPAGQAAEAHRLLNAGGVRGRIVLAL